MLKFNNVKEVIQLINMREGRKREKGEMFVSFFIFLRKELGDCV